MIISGYIWNLKLQNYCVLNNQIIHYCNYTKCSYNLGQRFEVIFYQYIEQKSLHNISYGTIF